MSSAFDIHDPDAKGHGDPDWKWIDQVEVVDPEYGHVEIPGRWWPRTADPEHSAKLLAEARGDA